MFMEEESWGEQGAVLWFNLIYRKEREACQRIVIHLCQQGPGEGDGKQGQETLGPAVQSRPQSHFPVHPGTRLVTHLGTQRSACMSRYVSGGQVHPSTHSSLLKFPPPLAPQTSGLARSWQVCAHGATHGLYSLVASQDSADGRETKFDLSSSYNRVG